jgi:hypothetical protein
MRASLPVLGLRLRPRPTAILKISTSYSFGFTQASSSTESTVKLYELHWNLNRLVYTSSNGFIAKQHLFIPYSTSTCPLNTTRVISATRTWRSEGEAAGLAEALAADVALVALWDLLGEGLQ